MNISVTKAIYDSTIDNAGLTSIVGRVKLSDQYRQSAVLHYAVAEKRFDLTQQSCTAAEFARSFGMVESKVPILLNALVALGLLKKDDNPFVNTELSSQYLTSTSDDYIGAIVEHQYPSGYHTGPDGMRTAFYFEDSDGLIIEVYSPEIEMLESNPHLVRWPNSLCHYSHTRGSQ